MLFKVANVKTQKPLNCRVLETLRSPRTVPKRCSAALKCLLFKYDGDKTNFYYDKYSS